MKNLNLFQPDHKNDLNPPQLEAVNHFTGPIMVFAGAGSGKTRVLTRRIVSLIVEHGVAPDSIMAVTFTNKASEEMRHRISTLLGDGGKRVWMGTFHSTALRILRRHGEKLGYKPNFAIYDDDDSRKVIKGVLSELKIDEKKHPPRFYSGLIDKAKNSGISAENYPAAKDWLGSARVDEVYEHYQRALLRANAMDFGDLLLNIVRLLKENDHIREVYNRQIKFILVDEFQDTNSVQYEFLRLLTQQHQNIFVVGDDDQSIYGFRGANIANISYFKRDYKDTKVIKLEQNYRSTTNILEAANSVIKANKGRTPKKLWTDGEEGSLIGSYVAWDEQDEARFIATQISHHLKEGIDCDKIAILYRTNAQSRAIEEALLDQGIPYRIYGGLKFYDRREIKDIIAYLKLLINESDNQSFLRVVNVPTRGVGARSIEVIYQRAIKEEISLFESARREGAGGGGNKGVGIFIKLIDSLRAEIDKTSLPELIEKVIEQSTYGPKLKSLKTEEAESRLENLMELKAIGASIEIVDDNKRALTEFLDRVSLSSSQELPVEEGKDAIQSAPTKYVSLMTLHLAKGLEFPVVFLTGLEDGLLPHSRSIDEGNVDEERRLCYVGITRAMKQLYISRAKSRGMFSSGASFGAGSGGYREVSRFAKDIPENRLEHFSEKFNSFSAWSDSSIEIDQEFLESEQGFEKRLKKAKEKAAKIKPPPSKAPEKKEEKGKSFKFRSGWLTSADKLSS